MTSKLVKKLILIVVAGIAPLAWAGEECSLSTLQGDYLVTGLVQPRVDQRESPTLPGITVATWTFDGAGNFTALAIQNFGGDYREVDTGGTYTVSERCVVIVTFPQEMVTFKGVLTHDGTEADAIRTNPDLTGRVPLASRHLKKSSTKD